MRVACMVATCVSGLGCLAVSTAFQTSSNAPKSTARTTLWECGPTVLFPALRQFAYSPGTQPDRGFVNLVRQKDGTILFERVPKEWFTWKEKESERRILILDRDGFRIILKIEVVASLNKELLGHIEYGQGFRSIILMEHLFSRSGDDIARIIECPKYKGDTNFIEHRYYGEKQGAIHVEFHVFDEPGKKKTLDEMLFHLRSHYGKYEAVCEKVEALIVDDK